MIGEQSILIVESDNELRFAVTRMLRASGYKVLEAVSATQAIELSQYHHPALVLVSVELPGGNGIEVSRQLKSGTDLVDILVVLLFGFRVTLDVQADALSRGLADGCITQPIREQDFLVRIDTYMRIHASQKAQREGALRLQLAVRAGRVGLWDWDLRTNRVFYSHEWKQQIGYQDEEITDSIMEWRSRVHPDDLERTLAIIQAYIAQPWPDYSVEFRLRHKNGSYRWITAQASLFLDAHAKPVRMLGSHTDITERKRVEERQRLNEARLNALLELSQTASQMDEKEIIGLALEMAVDLTQSQIGYFHFFEPDQQTIRLSIWSRATREHCDAAVIEDHYSLHQAGIWADSVRLRQPVIHNDYQGLPHRKGYPEGHSHVTRHMSIPVLEQDQVVMVIGVGNKASDYEESDVRQLQLTANEAWRIIRRKQTAGELRQAVDRYRQLFMDTQAIGLLIDPDDGSIVDANRMALDYYGYGREQITQLKISDINTLSQERIDQEIQRAREQKCNHFVFQHRLASGEIRDVEVSVSRVQTQKKVLLYSIVRDITERKRIEMEREALYQQLLDVSRKAGMAEIATGVLHNVGNVLNSINVAVSLLDQRLRELRVTKLRLSLRMLRDLLSPTVNVPIPPSDKLPRLLDYLDTLATYFGSEQHHMLEELCKVKEHVDHIKLIVNRQQDYASSYGISEPVAVEKMLDDVLVMNIASSDRIDIHRDYQPLPPIITDKHRLAQIIVNLIRNAKQAMTGESQPTDRQRWLKVGLQRQHGDRPVLRIEVSDNGVGIAPEHLTQVFAFGFTTKSQGHGFGLHSSANLARELGGRLCCHSQGLNQGATFTLELPFNLANNSDEPYSARNL